MLSRMSTANAKMCDGLGNRNTILVLDVRTNLAGRHQTRRLVWRVSLAPPVASYRRVCHRPRRAGCDRPRSVPVDGALK